MMIHAEFDYRDSAWVAEVLHIDETVIEDLMSRGELPGFRIGHKWLVSEEKLRQFLRTKEEAEASSFPGNRPDRMTNASSLKRVRTRNATVTYRLLGETFVAPAFKEMLVKILKAFSERDGDFLSRFSKERGRKRHYVSRDPRDLYPGKPDLVRNAKEPLGSGWWVGTNYSAKEIELILRKACEVAKLHWGKDLVIETEDEAERIRRAMSIVGIASDPDPNASVRHDELFVEATRK